MIRHTKLLMNKMFLVFIGISIISSFSLVVLDFIPSSRYMSINILKISSNHDSLKFDVKLNFKGSGFYEIGLNIRNGVPLVGCARLFLRRSEKRETILYDFSKYFPKKCLRLIDNEKHRKLKLVIYVSKDVFGLKKIVWKEYKFR